MITRLNKIERLIEARVGPRRNRDWIKTVGPVLGDNLVLNGGFETAGGGGADIWANWTEVIPAGGAIADETVLVHSGGHAAKLTGVAGDYTRVETEWPYLTVVPGTTVNLLFWTQDDGVHAGVHMAYDGTHSGWIDWGASNGIVGSAYTELTFPYVIPSGCTSMIFVVGAPAVNGGIAYFDDVSVYRCS